LAGYRRSNFIGGASLMGGRGGMFNTLFGALILGIITNITLSP
jgi:ribose/xylose/arabinose/galactoside ABC-type transport system permease subunit